MAKECGSTRCGYVSGLHGEKIRVGDTVRVLVPDWQVAQVGKTVWADGKVEVTFRHGRASCLTVAGFRNVWLASMCEKIEVAQQEGHMNMHEAKQMKLDLIVFNSGMNSNPLKIDLDAVPAFADFTANLIGTRRLTLMVLNGCKVQEFSLRLANGPSNGPFGGGSIAGTFCTTMQTCATPAAAKGTATRMYGWKDRTPNTKTLRELLQTVIDNNADQIDTTGFQAAEALAAFFIWATTPAPAVVEVVKSLPTARHARYTVLLNSVIQATGLPYSDAYHRAAGIAIKQPGGATLIDCQSPHRPEHFSPVAPAPIIEVDPAGDVKVVGFETAGLPNADQIRAGIQMLAKTPEGRAKQQLLTGLGFFPPITEEEANMKDAPTGKGPSQEVIQEAIRLFQTELNQNAEAIGEVLSEEEIRQTLLADLKAAGVTAYLLAIAMMQTEIQIHMNPVPVGAQAPSDQQRAVLHRISEFAWRAEAGVKEESRQMMDAALEYALTSTIRIIGDDRPADSYVAAAILGRLLQYLTGRDAGTIARHLHTWGRLTDRDMTDQETRLFEAYRRLEAAAVADDLREDR